MMMEITWKIIEYFPKIAFEYDENVLEMCSASRLINYLRPNFVVSGFLQMPSRHTHTHTHKQIEAFAHKFCL